MAQLAPTEEKEELGAIAIGHACGIFGEHSRGMNRCAIRDARMEGRGLTARPNKRQREEDPTREVSFSPLKQILAIYTSNYSVK